MIARWLVVGLYVLFSLVGIYLHTVDVAIYFIISSLLVNDLLKEVEGEERDQFCK